ncbi:hypothetical protein HDU67_004691 [Dinochytrium kinnereticum]|nr:hypothetical protein HDU67_004691 [Dinochytrium kinnereticum]
MASRSTVQLGTAFEHQVQRTLLRYAFALTRVGGADDRGIDLRGLWHLNRFNPPPPAAAPTLLHPVPVLIQCKYEKASLGPRIIREMEGVLLREVAPGSLSSENARRTTVGILASSSGFSPKARTQFMSSRFPMMLLTDAKPVYPPPADDAVVHSVELCMNLTMRTTFPGLVVTAAQGGVEGTRESRLAVFWNGIGVTVSEDEFPISQ